MENEQIRNSEELPRSIVSVTDLSVSYGNVLALKDISLEVPAGKITALIGPSGCGKSTFLRTLNRMHDLTPNVRISGKVIVDGEDIHAPETDAVALRRKTGMVFQRSNPFPKSIFENIAYGPRLNGIKKRSELAEIVERSLRRAELWGEVKDRLNQSAFAISGGQQQRLCIARALAVEPSVLLMDEPASALDPKATLKIEELIQELAGDYSLLVVTHNLHQASRISEHTAFFYEGNLVEYASTRDIFERPQDSRTEDYVTGRFG